MNRTASVSLLLILLVYAAVATGGALTPGGFAHGWGLYLAPSLLTAYALGGRAALLPAALGLLALAALPLGLAGLGMTLAVGAAVGLLTLRERGPASAARDRQTGLPDRSELRDRLLVELAGAASRKRRLCLLLVDLDRFGAFSSRYGRQNGDRAVWLAARRIAQAVRPSDLIVRYAGDQFALVLLEAADGAGMAETIAEQIRSELAALPFPVGERRTARLTVSIGYARYPEDALSAGALIQRAGSALEAAKDAGRDRAVGWADLPGRRAELAVVPPAAHYGISNAG